ncbi:MAG: hypothetical protein WCL02_07125 [bacterium]
MKGIGDDKAPEAPVKKPVVKEIPSVEKHVEVSTDEVAEVTPVKTEKKFEGK